MSNSPSTPKKDIYQFLYRIARLFWHDLDNVNEQRRLVGAGDVITSLYSLPLVVIGLIWLITETNLSMVQPNWPFFVLNVLIYIFLIRFTYFIVIEIRSDRYGSSDGSFATVIQWSLIFIFGPTALWLSIFYSVANFSIHYLRSSSKASRWNLIRNLTTDIATATIAALVGLQLYRAIGGSFPIVDLSRNTLIQGFATLLFYFILVLLIWSGYFIYHVGVQRKLAAESSIMPIVQFFALSLGITLLANPYSILMAGLFVEDGFFVYMYLLIGLLIVAYLARQTSMMTESSRQKSRQLEKIEQLGESLLAAPLDASTLPEILARHVPAMFPSAHISIWKSPGEYLLNYPEDWENQDTQLWPWLLKQSSAQMFPADTPLPWDPDRSKHIAMVVAPIIDHTNNERIGGVLVEFRELARAWDKKQLVDQFPAIQSIASQIASFIHQAAVYLQSLDLESLAQEIRLAGQIQASFLPNKFPSIPGWQLSVTLLPARETSGDYFDVIEMSEGRLGLLIADVVDKGVGAALYMALSRTLIRTYAEEYEADPQVVFFAANQRLIRDARANLFVTAFYGILEPNSGKLTYANAGHNPPFLIRADGQNSVETLTRTGIAMGIEEESTWNQGTVEVHPGDVLLLYTDGIPDAQNRQGEFFEDDPLIDITTANRDRMASEIQNLILENLDEFVGGEPQSDDITLMILIRDT